MRYRNKIISRFNPWIIDYPDLSRDTRTRSRQLRKNCTGANMVYSGADRVFLPDHYFASKSFAAFRKVFTNSYLNKQVPNKTTHLLVNQFRGKDSVCDRNHVRRRTVSTGQTLCSVEEILQKKSLRKPCQQSGLPVTRVAKQISRPHPARLLCVGDFSKKGFIRITHGA